MGKVIITAILVIAYSIQAYSQTKISGHITDTNHNVISFVNVLLKQDISSAIDTYTYSNKNGEYILTTDKTGKFNLTFSSMGFERKTLTVNIDGIKKVIHSNVVLKEKTFELQEVIVHAELPMVQKKDTIRFKTKFYTKGNEQTVEDLLMNIPGLNIDSQGTIKVGNQEIEKLMIDGDDLFEKGYKILSKNMPSYPIEEVEILKNYSNNRLLKGIEESDKVALNLKLDEKSKRIWFGNTKIGYGYSNYYDLKANLMNFGKKNKYYFLTNFNTIGEDATGDINLLIRSHNYNQPASIGDNHQVRHLLNLTSSPLSFKKSRTNFNKAKLLSLNAIFKPTIKLKIKTLGFLNWDKQAFFRNSSYSVTTSETDFTNTELFELQNKKITGFGKLNLTYNISKTKMLESTTTFNKGNVTGLTNLDFNGRTSIENLQTNNRLFDQKISFSNKLQGKKAFLLTGRFIDEKAPQDYAINQFLFSDLFPDSSGANRIQQQIQNRMQFAGIESHLLHRKENGNLLELQLGNEFRKELLNTDLTLFDNSNILATPDAFQNNTIYTTDDLYLKSKYRYKLNDLAISGKLGIHQLFNSLKFDGFSKKQNPFFINPSMGLEWKINDKNKINSSYSYTISNAKILDVYNNYALTGFRTFSKGTGDFNQLNASTFLINYQLGNWSDRFFANAFIFYNKNFDFFSNNTLINQNYTQSEKTIIKNKEFMSISSKIDYYFKKISSNLKINLGYSKSNYKNRINNSNLRKVTSNQYKYGLSLRSGFKGIFNYHFGSKWTTKEIKTTPIRNAYTDNESFLDFSFVFNDKFTIQLQSERYFFGNLNTKNNTYYFLDFNTRYVFKKNQLSMEITGKNLFNTKIFRSFSISDIGSYTTEYKLLPRFVLLKIEYRF